MTNNTDLHGLLENLDEELSSALAEALREEPEVVRDHLREEGFIDGAQVHSEPELTDAEAALLDIVEDVGNPKSSGELQEIIEIEYQDKLSEYNSLKHRTWISDKLNSLVKKGYLGKYREGREMKFTADPEEAVSRWALHHDKFASDLTRSDAEDIAADTGMRIRMVRRAIKNL
jgi:hypothetical protein